MKLGDKVWIFDSNRRIYPKDGGNSAQPIWAEHFSQAIIEGETLRSWIIKGEKFPKKDPFGIYTDEQKADTIWDHENRYAIINKIKSCDIDLLKKIHQILEGK